MDSKFNSQDNLTDKSNIHMRYIHRAENYRKNISINYFEILENSRLSLRKEKLNDLIQTKRNRYFEESKNIFESNDQENNNKIAKQEVSEEIDSLNKRKKSEDKCINERFLNLSLNKNIDCVRSYLNRNHICFVLEKNVIELNSFNLKNIKSFNIEQLKFCVFKLRNLLIEKNSYIPYQIQVKLYESLFVILEKYSLNNDYNEELIFESLWSLTNLCVIYPLNEIQETIIKRNQLKYLESYLLSKNSKIREQAIWCFGNLIGDSTILKQQFFTNKILLKVLDAINDINVTPGITKIGMWLISQVAKGKPGPRFEDMSICIVTVTSSLWSNEEEVVGYALQTLTYLTFCDNQFSKLIFSSNCLKKLIDYAYIKKKKFCIPCLRILGNLLHLDNTAEPLINNGILKLLSSYLIIEENSLLCDVIWCIKQLSNNSTKIVNLIIESETLMINLTSLLFKPKSSKTIKEDIFRIIINIIANGDQITLEYFLTHEIILTIKTVIDSTDYTPTLYFSCMIVIEKLLTYEDVSERKRENIIQMLINYDFHNIFETTYFKFKNSHINKIIERILNICNNKNHEQMIF